MLLQLTETSNGMKVSRLFVEWGPVTAASMENGGAALRLPGRMAAEGSRRNSGFTVKGKKKQPILYISYMSQPQL